VLFPTQAEFNSTCLNRSCRELWRGVISMPGKLLLVLGILLVLFRPLTYYWQKYVGTYGCCPRAGEFELF